MSFSGSGCAFTRYRILDEIPQDLWPNILSKLRQYAFQDIDEIPEERSWGWVSFEDMLDMTWENDIPEKGSYLAFGFRLDTRSIPPAVMKKHMQLALREELKKIEEKGKKFIARERKKELRELVKLRLLRHVYPVPAVFDVIWSVDSGIVMISSVQPKLLDLIVSHFTLTFGLHLDPLTPYALAEKTMAPADAEQLDMIEASDFTACLK